MINIKFLRAHQGDSVLISYTDSEKIKRNILIDGGIGSTYYENNTKKNGDLYEAIQTIKNNNQKLDLLVLTHIDDDHIGGILRWFSKDKEAHQLINNVWFNSGKTIANYFDSEINDHLTLNIEKFDDAYTSVKQGIDFEKYIEENNIWDKNIILSGCEHIPLEGIKINILSPNKDKLNKLLKEYEGTEHDYFTSSEETDWSHPLSKFIEEENSANFKFKEDKSIPNGSSIAFILTFNEKNYIFLGDSHPSVIIESLNDLGYLEENSLDAELLKVSHHGSCYNTNKELLNLIKTDNYVISSDGTSDNLPNKRTFARIVKKNPKATIHFNYENLIKYIFTDKDREDFSELTLKPISEYQ